MGRKKHPQPFHSDLSLCLKKTHKLSAQISTTSLQKQNWGQKKLRWVRGKIKSHQKQHLRQKFPKWGGQKKQSFRGKEEARDQREVNTAFLKKIIKKKKTLHKVLMPHWTLLWKMYLHPSWIAISNPLAMAWWSHCCLMACGKDGCLEDFRCTVWVPREEIVNVNCTAGIQCGKCLSLLPELYLFYLHNITSRGSSGDPELCWSSFVMTQSNPVLASVTSNKTSI